MLALAIVCGSLVACGPGSEPDAGGTVGDAEVERLLSLGYVDGVDDPEDSGSGVVLVDEDRAQPGYTLAPSSPSAIRSTARTTC